MLNIIYFSWYYIKAKHKILSLRVQNRRLMLKKIKYFLLLLIVFSVVFVGYFISLDSNFKVERSRLIKAPQNLVFQQVADLHNWSKWAPWKEKDSTMQFDFSEKTNAEGDYLRFTDTNGLRQQLTNISLRPDTLIVQTLSSEKQNQNFKWQLTQQEDGVLVKWTIQGEVPFLQRIYTKHMDDLMGPTITRGLERLEQSVRKDLEKRSVKIDKVTSLSSTYYLYKSVSCRTNEVEKVKDKLLAQILSIASENHIQTNRNPFTLYIKWDTENQSAIISVCLPTKEKMLLNADVLTGETPGGAYLKVLYQGDYKFINEAWNQARNYIQKDTNLVEDLTRQPIEVYIVDKSKNLNPANWLTEIYVPILEVAPQNNLPQ